MESETPAGPAPAGLPALILTLLGIFALGGLIFAILGGAILGLDALFSGPAHVEDLLVTARDAARTGEQRTLEMTGIAFGCVIYLSAILAMLAMAWLRRRGAWREPLAWVGFNFSRTYWGLVAVGIVWGLAASVTVERLHPAARDWFTLPKAPLPVIASFLLIVVLAPLAEELFFRGWLFTALRGRFGATATIAVTAFLFAIGHWEKTHLYAAAVLPVGILLGWMRERTGSTRATALFHALYNLTGWMLTYLALA